VVRAAQFGRLMWLDTPRHLGKCGNGVTRGTGMNLMAGGYLGKLKVKKWIGGGHSGYPYHLTEAGKKVLEESRQK